MLNPHRAVVFLAKRSREKVGEGSEAILTSAPPVEFRPRRRRDLSRNIGNGVGCVGSVLVGASPCLFPSCIMSDINTGPMALMMMDSVQNPILNSLILFLIIGTDL